MHCAVVSYVPTLHVLFMNAVQHIGFQINNPNLLVQANAEGRKEVRRLGVAN